MRILGKKTALRLADVADAPFILRLRLDGELNRHLSPVEDDLAKQEEWLRRYKRREAEGTEYYFVIEAPTGTPCGTVRLYDFRGESFSWGSWIVRPGSPTTAALESALLVYDHGFGPLGFTRSHFEVRKENARVVAFHQRFGARVVSEDAHNFYFDFTADDYAKIRPRYARLV